MINKSCHQIFFFCIYNHKQNRNSNSFLYVLNCLERLQDELHAQKLTGGEDEILLSIAGVKQVSKAPRLIIQCIFLVFVVKLLHFGPFLLSIYSILES